MIEKIKKIHDILHGNSNAKLYLFGASVTGEQVYNQIIEITNGSDKIVAFVDNNPELQGKSLFNLPIINKYQLKDRIEDKDIVLISSNKFVPISNDLEKLGIQNHVKCDSLFVKYCYEYVEGALNNKQPWEKAISWLMNNIVEGGGFRATSNHENAYPEVTGYIIPTLIQYGYYNEAKEAVKWLLSLQKENGAFCGIPGTDDEYKEYIFDSGQILRGLLEFTEDAEINNKIRIAIEKVCDYMINQMIENGKAGFITQYKDNTFAVEPILIYTLAPLKKAAIYLGKSEYLKKIENCLEFYISHIDFMKPETLTHFLAYQMEALIELDKKELIEDIIVYIQNSFDKKGFIPGKKNANWTCSTGNAQIAICCYLTGRHELGNKIMTELEQLQLSTGGFMGSYGESAEYFPSTEISWADKYYLDANRLRIQEWFNDNVSIFPTTIKDSDAEFLAIEEHVKDNMNIAEIGCGKGRFLKLLNQKFNNLSLTGVDISKEMIACLPNDIKGVVGALEHIPLEDETYDIVLCIEAIEHSINVELSVKELVRILKPNGTLIIIDKNVKHWGRLECPSWEQWFDKENMLNLIKKHCIEAECRTIDLYGQKSDDMFLMWKGVK